MNLFGKEKELIHKIINGILLIWFVAALAITTYNIVVLFVENPEVTSFEVYKNAYCYNYMEEEDEEEFEKNAVSCKEGFISNKKTRDYNNKMNIFAASINALFVGSTVFILNKPKKANK